jgi:hypothetical protein
LDFVPGPSRTVCALGPPTQNPPCIWAARNGEGMFDLRSILSLVCCARAQGCAGPASRSAGRAGSAARPAIAALDFSPGPSRAVCTLGPRSKNPPCIRAARDGESFTPVKNGPAARLRRWIFRPNPHVRYARSGLGRKIRLLACCAARLRRWIFRPDPHVRYARSGLGRKIRLLACCAARLRRWIFCQDPHALLVRSGLRRKIRLALAALATVHSRRSRRRGSLCFEARGLLRDAGRVAPQSTPNRRFLCKIAQNSHYLDKIL